MRESLQSSCAPVGTRLSQVHVPDTVTVRLVPLTLSLLMTTEVGLGAFANAGVAIAARTAGSTATRAANVRRVCRGVPLPPWRFIGFPSLTLVTLRGVDGLGQRLSPVPGSGVLTCSWT